MGKPIHSHGMRIIASTSEPDPSKLPTPTKECKVLWRSFFKRTYACGHRDSRRFRVSVFGKETKVIKQNATCPACFIEETKKHTIFCALCGLPIMPGDPVALYDDDNDNIRDEATHLGNSVLGCLRWNCCPTAGFLAGCWTKEGFESAFN